MNKYLVSVLLATALSGCASSPDKMASAYVSPIQYQDYDCKQVGAELTRVSRRAQELYGQLDKTASNDAAQMAVGMVLFWPALFFLEGGDGPEAAEYARLKGERDALKQVAIQKHCDPGIIPPAMEPSKPEAAQTQEPRRNYNRPITSNKAKPD